MEDIISQGDDRKPVSWRRRLAIGGVLAAVAAALIVEHLPEGSGPGGGHPLAAPSASARPHAHGERSFPIRLRVEGPASDPSRIIGGTAVWGPSAKVPRTGPRPDWFWPGEGRTQPILGLPDNPAGYEFTRVTGGWAVQPIGPAGCGDCAGQVEPVYYLANQARRAIMVGDATKVAPAAGRGRLWLVSYPPGADLATATGIAREFSTSGEAVGPPVRLPTGFEISQATRSGLLLAPATEMGNSAAAELWNPATGQILNNFQGIVAASANSVAYVPRCVVTCAVHVRDLATGHGLVIDVASGSAVTGAVFSPDGRYLALQVTFADGGDGGALAMRLEVASMATGQLAEVPRTFVSSDALAGFGWPGNGDDLVAKLDFPTRVQMATWVPGAPTLAIAVVKTGERPDALVVG
ncbi:MAG TPA: hypothetical protein VFQ44_01465 [Streptosporangiaceae bacterium]|nr:hypothetical protein [Streptosporangiaceae bacterium]